MAPLLHGEELRNPTARNRRVIWNVRESVHILNTFEVAPFYQKI
jgi:hypothetical protein